MRASRVVSVACLVLPAAVQALAASGVRLSEVHYHPAGDLPLEFIELRNAGSQPVDLLGWSFTDGVRFAFTRSLVVPPGGFVLLAMDAAAVAAELGVDVAAIAGELSGRLDDSGERLALVDGEGRLVEELTYSDRFPFDSAADGGGSSLQRVCFDLPADAPFNWRADPPTPGRLHAPRCPPPPPQEDLERSPVVLHEIHYHPPGDPEPPLEYVELSNRGAAEQDLSRWTLEKGVAFTFPPGTRIAAGGYLLVAQDPAALAARFGIDRSRILGPFEKGSRLSNSGETVRLADATGSLRDEVTYADEGPWPAFADGLGGSLQRVSALGPTGAPGNWRAALPPAVGEGTSEWRTFRVEGEHDGPRFYFYLLGAGEVLIDRVSLVLKDDPSTALLSGGEFDDGLAPWSGTGNHIGSRAEATGGFGDGGPCARVVATGPGNGFQHAIRQTLSSSTVPGTRVVLTLHVKHLSGDSRFVARASIATSDNGLLYLEADARTGDAGGGLTPLAPNSVGGPTVPPTLELVELDPPWPTSRDAVAVRARVVSATPVEVVASSQVGTGPSTETPLRDDGAAPDLLAGDGVWSGALPAAPSGSLVWLSLRAVTAEGAASWWPPFKNPVSVTGYYVTDSLPEQNEHLRLFYIFTPGALADLSCDDGARRDGDFVDFRGRAYRGVGVKFRGETACGYPKRPIRVELTKGDLFDRQRDLNFNAGWNDKSMLRERFAFDLFRDAGVAASECHMARVHTRGGAFHGVYFTVEDPTEEYLRRNGRDPGGALYKCRTPMLSGGTGGYEPRTDSSQEKLQTVSAFAAQLNASSGQALIDLLVAAMDVDGVFDYHATKTIICDGDSVVKNWILYLGRREVEASGPELFSCSPWDLDLTYGQMLLTTDQRWYDVHPLFQTQTYPFYDQGYHGIYNALLQRAPGDYFVKAYYGRMWHLLEEKFREEVLFPRLDEYEAATGAAVREDLRKWPRWGPRGTDPDYWRRDHRTFIQRRREFLTTYVQRENPTTQGRKLRYVPAPRVKLTEIHFNPPGQGAGLEFVELTSLDDFPVDVGGWSIPLLEHVFAPGTAIGPRESILVAKDPDLLRSAAGLAGVTVLGPYPGELPGAGGILRLIDDGAGGKYYPETIDIVAYDDEPPWPEEADGGGKSLELAGTSLDNDHASSWRAGWSPGRAAAANAAPAARIDARPGAGPEPLQVLLSALSSTDPDGDELRFSWSLPEGAGAGSLEERAVLLGVFDRPGKYRVSLTARDAFGGEGKAEVEVSVEESLEPRFRRGDSSSDGQADLSDAVSTLNFLFTGGAAPVCPDAADSGDDGEVNISDAIYLLAYLFTGGPAPPPPGAGACGVDPTADGLGSCIEAPGCAVP
ncbi:MAG: CotH kinase family protein [Planctomycetes bacterium]|nr:CotH kinase family protein [Planctomycetota bacterium]